jgi:hypothetical protein
VHDCQERFLKDWEGFAFLVARKKKGRYWGWGGREKMYKGAQIENGLSKWALVSGGDEAWSVS